MKHRLISKALVVSACAWLVWFSPAAAEAAPRQVLRGHVPSAAARLQPEGRLAAGSQLTLALSLPLRNQGDLTTLLRDLYDPASPRYHQYVTADQFTERFGPTAQDYATVIGFARAHGLSVSGRHPNRLVLDVSGPVAAIEEAFRIRMQVYKHPREDRTFYSPDTEPSVDADVPLKAISGLDNYVLPHPMNLKRRTATAHQPQEVRSYATGSGPGGDFMGNDFRSAYVPGVTNTGAGQTIALFQFGTFSSNSIYIYQTNAHLSTNIVVTAIGVNGYNTTYAGTDDGEECLDIEMSMCLAPGASILVYEGNNGTDIFNKIATDNLAKQISCSWGWSPFDASLENTFKQFAAQGQSCYIASGDGGAEVGSIFPPGDDPYVTIVGGTDLTTSGAGGPWQSETTWIGSSGGVSTKYAIPSWQQGISMLNNQGSTTMRNVPDVAMLADTVIFWVFKNGTTGTVGGTSAAAPLWAAFTALVNQQAAAQGKSPAGFINPAVYALGKGVYATYASCFHDVTTGNNFNSSSPGKYSAYTGYDLCTGWGTPNGLNAINFLAGTGTNDFTFYATQTGFSLTPGATATTILSVFPLAGFNGSVSLSVSGLPSGVSAAFSPASTTTTSLLTLTSTSATAPGTSTVTVTGTSGGLTHAITLSLTVIAPIPGATQVSLSSVFNRAGIYTDGRTFSGGVDGSGYACSANLLGSATSWNSTLFNLGPANVTDVISCSGQTVTLPAGQYTTLLLLGMGINGSQNNQAFTVTYSDNSTAAFTQSLSDWFSPQNYGAESLVATMPYRDSSGGGKDNRTFYFYGYSFTLNQAKTVKSLTLPNNGNVIVLAITVVNAPASASLAGYFNRAGMYTDGTTFTNPATGGLDGGGAAYSASLLGYAQTWNGVQFNFGPANATNVTSAASQTIPLPAGNYSALRLLATSVQASQAGQVFTVTYADTTTGSLSQSLSDWYSPQNYAGESKAVIMGHRNSSDGSKDNRTFYLYGYSLPLNSSKVLQSLRLPNNANVEVLAISLIPNWQPTFTRNPFTEPALNAGQSCSGTIATNATDLNGDSLTFAKVSGPAWLNVASNGALSGVPSNSDAGTNTFSVKVTDTGGLTNAATLSIYVNGVPSFTLNPFTEPGLNAGQSCSGTLATNATDPNPGDTLTFAKVSGPAWLTVAGNGVLSGAPANSDAGTNAFVVRVTDPAGLSGTATMYLYVNSAPSFTANPLSEPGVTAGQPCSGTLATNAADPNPGDILTFAKVNGPAWLSVAGDGGLSGTPLSGDVGPNSFVVSVTDPGGLSASATLNIAVTPAPPMVATVALQDTNVLLNWTGGIAPYQVQIATDLSALSWQPLGAPTSATSLLLPATNAAAFYRILGQ